MKSVRAQLLVTLLAALAAAAIFCYKGPPPSELVWNAAGSGHLDQVRRAIEWGDPVNVRDQRGHTPFFLAVTCNKMQVAEFLVAHGADVNVKDNEGDAPLHLVVASRDDRAKFLIANGADVNSVGFEGETPLILVAFHPDLYHVVELLIAGGADVNIKTSWGETPLARAIMGNNRETGVLLLRHGARPPEGITPLHLAAYSGEILKADFLFGNFPDVNAAGFRGLTPLHLAADRKTAVFLLTLGAGLRARDSREWTPLHSAAWAGRADVAAVLIAAGADVNAKAKLGLRPLHLAAIRCHKEVVELLLARGADVNSKDDNESTPLHWVGTSEVAKILIAHGADVSTPDGSGATPLEKAVCRDWLDVVELLIAKGADVNAKSGLFSNRSPLRMAIIFNYAEMAELLRRHGAKE